MLYLPATKAYIINPENDACQAETSTYGFGPWQGSAFASIAFEDSGLVLTYFCRLLHLEEYFKTIHR